MNQNKKTKRWLDLIIAICIGMFLLGTIFRIQHWPFGREMKLFSLVLLGAIVLFIGLRHFQNAKKHYLSSIGVLVILLIIGIEFHKLLLFTTMDGLFRPLLLLSTIWLVLFLVLAMRGKAMEQITLGSLIAVAGVGCVVGEVILMRYHLPLASVLSVVGLLIVVIGLLINYFRNK